MGLFSFGGSKSRSSSFSSSFDNLDAYGVDFGFNTSRSESASRGASSSLDRSRTSTDQNIAFEDVFARMFGRATNAADRAVDASGGVSDAAGLLFNSGTGVIDRLSGGGAGAEFLEGRLSGTDVADAQIGRLSTELERFLTEDANRAITSGGVAAGTFGGTRGEVREGIALRGATEALALGTTDILKNEQAARDSAAGVLLGSETDRGATALAGLPGLAGLAELGANAELSPLMALSGIIGPQTALTTSRGTSFGTSQSEQLSQALSEALGLNIGINQTTGRAGSTSESESTAKSKRIGFGFGE